MNFICATSAMRRPACTRIGLSSLLPHAGEGLGMRGNAKATGVANTLTPVPSPARGRGA